MSDYKNLDNEDLISMVRGQEPHYSVFNHSLVKSCGCYVGGFHDHWSWTNSALEKLTKNELLELYRVCKESWKKS